jgi:hypothetical protein
MKDVLLALFDSLKWATIALGACAIGSIFMPGISVLSTALMVGGGRLSFLGFMGAQGKVKIIGKKKGNKIVSFFKKLFSKKPLNSPGAKPSPDVNSKVTAENNSSNRDEKNKEENVGPRGDVPVLKAVMDYVIDSSFEGNKKSENTKRMIKLINNPRPSKLRIPSV